MLETLNDQPVDGILRLMNLFREDPREDKIDLGVGVYRNSGGITPIMRSIKTAEKRWWEQENTKSYLQLTGDPGFSEALSKIILGDSREPERISSVATPGGTGAVRQALELVLSASPAPHVFISSPTWPNHPSILKHLGIRTSEYRYFDESTRGVDFDGMMEDIGRARKGDVILMHGCCHNPTGANLTNPEWDIAIEQMNKTGAIPMIDLAYQGFGDGLEADAYGTRAVAASCPEALIAASCSKNFGIYRERAGLLLVVSGDSSRRKIVQSNISHLNRHNYSFPPDHGTRLVTLVLDDPELRADWERELEAMRVGMLEIREKLARELQTLSGSDQFGFIAQHRGMFSRLGLGREKVMRLREEHGIYMVDDSRINVAGLNLESASVLARAIIEVGA
ncbi:MAG: aspartate/tyrosine/aromatic aminotransferase [Roseovarius sp.]|nr:aspartate/tyrosine/aromatic aminotransferase [Roseovarius sp.]